jgi:hypothetical protein
MTTLVNPYQKAVKHEAKLRLAIAGPSGAGKTYTSLAVATALAAGGRIALADTEHGSASKYADLFDFDVLELGPPYHPDRFVAAIRTAEESGYSVIILDTVSHAWNGTGGVLELVEQASKKFKGNSYMAWGEVTPIHNRLIEGIISSRIHVIATMRSKQDYILIERNGKQTPQKVGMAPIQRDGFEYEFDVFLDMDIENNAIVSKTRCPALTGRMLSKPGADLADILSEWLTGEPAPERPSGAAANAALHSNGGSGRSLPGWLKGADRITLETVLEAAETKLELSQADAFEMLQRYFELPAEARGRFRWQPEQQLTSDGALAMYWWLEEQLVPEPEA